MKTNRWVVVWVVTVAMSLNCLLSPTLAAEPSSFTRQQVADISLHASELRGQVVGAQGVGLQGVEVVATREGRVVAWTATDAIGTFRFADIKPGTLQITAAGSAKICRVWNAKVAPPSARKELLFVADELVVRAQHQMGLGSSLFGGTLVNALSNPLTLTGVMAAAIAIPVAVINEDDDAS